MLRAVLFASLLALPLLAADPPAVKPLDEDAVRALVAALGADDPSVRDDAEQKLRAGGEAVLGALRKTLASEAPKDPEARGRMVGIVAGLERDAQARAARVVLDKHLKGRKCDQCGKERVWVVQEMRGEILERMLPKVTVFQMSWTCCGLWDGPTPCLLVAVCRQPDAVIEFVSAEDALKLGPWLVPVNSTELAQDAGDALSGLAGICRFGSPDEYAAGQGSVEGGEVDGFTYRGGNPQLSFHIEKDGTLIPQVDEMWDR